MPCSTRVLQPAALLLFLFMSTSGLPAETFSTLVTMTPCRVMDTRNPNGLFGGPFIKGSSTRNVPIPNSSCQVPSSAVAYSLNVTVIPHGTLYFITVWPTGQAQPNASTLNSFQGYVIANAAIVPAGAGGSISVFASGDTDLIVDINGYYTNLQLPVVPPPVTIPPFPTVITQSSSPSLSTAIGVGASSSGAQNTALGYSALSVNTGAQNTAVGTNSLLSNPSGTLNSAFGAGALQANTSSNNTAVGALAMNNGGNAYENTAVGANALQNNSGAHNVALGYFALQTDGVGLNNTALGSNALWNVNGGTNNIAVGYGAGSSLVTGSNNIYIGSAADAPNESSVIRIGTNSQDQFGNTIYQSTYIPGINPNHFAGSAVYVDANGKLGIAPSSRRYKEDIQEIGMASDKLYQLRPVQFRYKKPLDDGTKPVQFGLIAEEVANVYPELVIHNKDGQIEGVQYQQLPALLLNEIQKQQRTLAFQNEQIRDLTARVAALEAPASKTISTAAVQQ